MKILVVGGGSGGHITPAVAVIRELIKLKPRVRVEFWTDRKYYTNVVKITTEIGTKWGREEQSGEYIRVRKVMAGKFHRYAGWGWKDYFINWTVTIKDLIVGNIVGLVGFVGGLVQSLVRLFMKDARPDVMFLKGGFVCLPVGLVARLFKIPYVIHESDAVPGLANRLLMKRASVVCTGFDLGEGFSGNLGACWRDIAREAREDGPERRDPEKSYSKSNLICVFTGTPVAEEFRPVTEAKQRSLKKTFGFDETRLLVIVTGGSQGSLHMDEAVREILPEMLKFASVGLVAGRQHYEDMIDLKKYEDWDEAKLKSNFRLWEFCTTMNELMGAADVVVSRAGATTVAELAALKKAVVLVPFEKLPGGHQVKNAERLEKIGAVKVVRDDRMVQQPGILLKETEHLVRSPKERVRLADELHKQARPEAAKHIAEIVIDTAVGKSVVAEVKEVTKDGVKDDVKEGGQDEKR